MPGYQSSKKMSKDHISWKQPLLKNQVQRYQQCVHSSYHSVGTCSHILRGGSFSGL
jgi:hypothetical protein